MQRGVIDRIRRRFIGRDQFIHPAHAAKVAEQRLRRREPVQRPFSHTEGAVQQTARPRGIHEKTGGDLKALIPAPGVKIRPGSKRCLAR